VAIIAGEYTLIGSGYHGATIFLTIIWPFIGPLILGLFRRKNGILSTDNLMNPDNSRVSTDVEGPRDGDSHNISDSKGTAKVAIS